MSAVTGPVDADVTSRNRALTKPGQYAILPRGARVLSTIPSFELTQAQVMTTPALGARFTEYELLIQPGGGTKAAIADEFEHFLFVIAGEIDFELDGAAHYFQKGGFAWLPPAATFSLSNKGGELTRMLWLRRRYEAVEGVEVPPAIVSSEQEVEAIPEDTYVEKHLIPYDDDVRYDMAFNLLVFEPGIYFSFVESHIMEHGLYMLDGRGVYYLNGDYIEVQKDDYIYMAPYCPQFFYATGWETGRYILYKDINRDYVAGL